MYETAIDTTQPVTRLEERAQQALDHLAEAIPRLRARVKKRRGREDYAALLIFVTSTADTAACALAPHREKLRVWEIAEALREGGLLP